VGSSLPLQSLLLFKRFVNNICSALWLANPFTNNENIPMEGEVAYDGAAKGSATRLT
jgi:hypothetical protein